MKKFFFFLFFICLLATPALADYTVDSVAVTAEVAKNGQTQVSTAFQLSFDTTTMEVSIPLPEAAVSGVSVENYRFSLEDGGDGPTVVISRRDGFLGVTTFQVRYSVAYADDGDEDADTFSLGLLSSRWARTIGSCSFQVWMSAPFETQPEIVSGYFGSLTDAETGLSVLESSFGGTVPQRMAWDSLSLTMTLPDGYFQVRSASIPVISVNLLSIILLLIWLLLIIYWRAKLWFPQTSSLPRGLLPEGVLPCQLPMVLDGSTCDVAVMILEWANLGYLGISRSVKGNVLLTRTMDMGSERSYAEQRLFYSIFGTKLRVAATPGRFSRAAAQFRSASRRSLSRVIFDRNGGNPVLVQIPARILLAISIGYTAYGLLPMGAGYVVLAVLAGIVGFLYSIYLHASLSRFAALRTYNIISIGCVVIMLALIPLSLMAGAAIEMVTGLGACLFSAIATAPGPRRSQRGIDAMAQAKGCRTFFREASWQRLQAFQSQNTRFFELRLPHAAALASDRQFALRFERLPIPLPDWLFLPLQGTRSAEALHRELAPILRQLREAFR